MARWIETLSRALGIRVRFQRTAMFFIALRDSISPDLSGDILPYSRYLPTSRYKSHLSIINLKKFIQIFTGVDYQTLL